MPEEKDQGKVEQPQAPLPGQSPKLPEKDFFEGDAMANFAEQLAELSPQKKTEPAPKPAAAKKEPCPGCPEEEKAGAKPKEERKPIAILKVKGKDIPVYSEDELKEFAQKGAYMTQERQKDSEWERDLEERERKLETMAPTLQRIVEYLDSGGRLPGMPGETKPKEEAEPEDEIIDPVAAKKFNELRKELDEMKKENLGLRHQQQVNLEKEAGTELTNIFESVTKEHPFEQVMHPEDEKRNVSQELYTGLVSFLANRDYVKQRTQPGFKMKPLQHYMADAAKTMSILEKHYKSSGPAAVEITAESVKTKYPQVAESLGQEAIEAYLKTKETGSAPVVKSSKSEPAIGKAKRDIKSLDDAIEQGMADPAIAEELENIGRAYRYKGG